MPKNTRLTGSEIRRLKPEKRLNSGLFSLSYALRGDTRTTVACVVSKQVSPKAVTRNTLKRRMRAAVQSARPLPPGFSMMLIAKKQAAHESFLVLRDDVHVLIERVRGVK